MGRLEAQDSQWPSGYLPAMGVSIVNGRGPALLAAGLDAGLHAELALREGLGLRALAWRLSRSPAVAPGLLLDEELWAGRRLRQRDPAPAEGQDGKMKTSVSGFLHGSTEAHAQQQRSPQ